MQPLEKTIPARREGQLDRLFGLGAAGSTVKREVRAGFTTFATMSYILFVNPDILARAIPVPNAYAQLLFATAVAAALGSLVMGLVARYPFAQAPGMGLNAYFAFTVVLGQHIAWQTALGAVFIEGLLFMALSVGGVRQAIVSALPADLKYATAAGIGLFLAIIGLKNAGIVVPNPATYVTLGSLSAAPALIAIAGFLLIGVLQARRVPGAILIGIAGASLLAIATHAPVYVGPEGHLVAFSGLPAGGPIQVPAWPTHLLLALDLRGACQLGLVGIVFTFLLVEVFDTAGTLIGLSAKAGFLDDQGNLPRANRAFFSDAVATAAGALLGTSTTTAYIESAAGIEEGGRTGLVAVVVGLLFLLSVFLWPLATLVPGAATAPALVAVGASMATNLSRIRWSDHCDSVAAFLTIVAMPFTFSIANGVSFGIIAYATIKLATGKHRDVHPLLFGLAVLLICRYIWMGQS